MDGSCAADVARRTMRVAVATTLRATTRSSRASNMSQWSIQSREGLHRRCGMELDPYGCCSHPGDAGEHRQRLLYTSR